MKLFEELYKYVRKGPFRPSNPKAGYNKTDYDPYGYYNPNVEAKKQNKDAFDGGEEDCIRDII
jgi:hypothetical protein